MKGTDKIGCDASPGLVRFEGLGSTATDGGADTLSTQSLPTAQIIEQLRQRLISPDFRDSVETKLSVLGELVYFTYRELTKRRTL